MDGKPETMRAHIDLKSTSQKNYHPSSTFVRELACTDEANAQNKSTSVNRCHDS